jgi:hypothetical protein
MCHSGHKPEGKPWHLWAVDGDIIQAGDRVQLAGEYRWGTKEGVKTWPAGTWGTVRYVRGGRWCPSHIGDPRPDYCDLKLLVVPDERLERYLTTDRSKMPMSFGCQVWALSSLAAHESVAQVDPRFLMR